MAKQLFEYDVVIIRVATAQLNQLLCTDSFALLFNIFFSFLSCRLSTQLTSVRWTKTRC